MTLEIAEIWTDRATYRPGEAARLNIIVTSADTAEVELGVQLTWLAEPLGEEQRTIARIAEGEQQTTLSVPLALPKTPFRGYGVVVTAYDANGEAVASRTTAVDVLAHWSQAPRYGFFSNFAPGDDQAVAAVEALARYHVTIAQFYDWMWRHYELMPPTEEFIDALDRPLSLKTVRAKVEACRRLGIAAMGYAAVYGAEPEYTKDHLDEVVYDANGKPYAISDETHGDLFVIMDIARGGPWHTRILTTMADAVREVPFDGLHLDQYGFPRADSFDAQGRPVDVGASFAPFIDDARVAVQQTGREVGVIFNAVENWPIKSVANTTQDAVYIEVWPPYVSFNDLQRLLADARQLAPSKQVILAAYMAPLGALKGEAHAQAEAATLLTSATIWANGGFHLLMGERDSALHHAYYVTHTQLRPEFAQVMRTYYDFVVRYMNVLADQRLSACGPDALLAIDVSTEGMQVSQQAEAGAVWTVARTMPGYTTLSLINLTQAEKPEWNEPTSPVTAREHLTTRVRLTGKDAENVRRVLAATPDDEQGRMVELAYTTTSVDGDSDAVELAFELPLLRYWTLVVFETHRDSEEEGHASHA